MIIWLVAIVSFTLLVLLVLIDKIDHAIIRAHEAERYALQALTRFHELNMRLRNLEIQHQKENGGE